MYYHGERTSTTSFMERRPLLESSPSFATDDTFTPRVDFGLDISYLTRPFMCIFFAKFFLSLTFVSIFNSIESFAVDPDQLNLTATQASILFHAFLVIVSITTIVWGLYADYVAGKFSVIIYSSVVCVVGSMFIPFAVISPNPHELSQWAATSLTTNHDFKSVFFILGLILVASGWGGSFFNIYTFAGDQIPDSNPDDIKNVIHWVYLFFNIGWFFADGTIILQQNVSHFFGYLIPVCSIVIAIIVFRAGKSEYMVDRPSYGEFAIFADPVKEALKRSRNSLLEGQYIHHWLDRARICFGGSYTDWHVEDVKKFFRLLIFLPNITLHVSCLQFADKFMNLQGQFMNMQLESKVNQSTEFLQIIFKVILILILIKVVFPYLAERNINWSPLKRIGLSIVAMVAALIIAGLVDFVRVNHCCIEQERDGHPTNVSEATVLYQVPQNILMSLSRIFFWPTVIELIMIEVPKPIHSFCLSCYWLFYFFGICLWSIIRAIVRGEKEAWYPSKDNINDGGHMFAYWFFIIAAVSLLNRIIYIFVKRRFYKQKLAAKKFNKFCRGVTARIPDDYVEEPSNPWVPNPQNSRR